VADFDGDGRVDLAVAQNGAATRLFRNVSAAPGLRVRLRAASANPDGIGSQVRAAFGERLGPVLEVRAGGGYWSQDSSALVITGPTRPDALVVRWPGGREMRVAVPSDAREIFVSSDSTTAQIVPSP
jgi:hypothetical protein